MTMDEIRSEVPKTRSGLKGRWARFEASNPRKAKIMKRTAIGVTVVGALGLCYVGGNKLLDYYNNRVTGVHDKIDYTDVPLTVPKDLPLVPEGITTVPFEVELKDLHGNVLNRKVYALKGNEAVVTYNRSTLEAREGYIVDAPNPDELIHNATLYRMVDKTYPVRLSGGKIVDGVYSFRPADDGVYRLELEVAKKEKAEDKSQVSLDLLVGEDEVVTRGRTGGVKTTVTYDGE